MGEGCCGVSRTYLDYVEPIEVDCLFKMNVVQIPQYTIRHLVKSSPEMRSTHAKQDDYLIAVSTNYFPRVKPGSFRPGGMQ